MKTLSVVETLPLGCRPWGVGLCGFVARIEELVVEPTQCQRNCINFILTKEREKEVFIFVKRRVKVKWTK